MNDYEHGQQYSERGLSRSLHAYSGVRTPPSPGQFTLSTTASPPTAAMLYGAGAADFGQWRTQASAAASSYANGMYSAYSPHNFMTHPSLVGRFNPSMLHSMEQTMQQSFGHHTSVGSNTFGIMGMAQHANAAAAAAAVAGLTTTTTNNGMSSDIKIKEEHMSVAAAISANQQRIDRGGQVSLVNAFESHSRSKKTHIKKPLNAFMLFMKEMRATVVAECTLKESAAINQILGRKWHALSREEQTKYYDMARKEKELHMQLYPGWSARDNYAAAAKRKKNNKRNQGEEDKQTEFYYPSGLNDNDAMKKLRHPYSMIDPTQNWCRSGEDLNSFYEQQKSYHNIPPLTTMANHHSNYPSMQHMVYNGTDCDNINCLPTNLCLANDEMRVSAANIAGAASSVYEHAIHHPRNFTQDGHLTLTDLS